MHVYDCFHFEDLRFGVFLRCLDGFKALVDGMYVCMDGWMHAYYNKNSSFYLACWLRTGGVVLFYYLLHILSFLFLHRVVLS